MKANLSPGGRMILKTVSTAIVFFRKAKISDQTFGMDILCAKEKILPPFHHMCHVVVRAEAPVTSVDILPSGEHPVAVHNAAEGAKFVFFMHGLEDGVRIDVCVKVKKGVYMYAVNAAGGVAGGAEILRGSQFGCAEKSGGGAIGGQITVSVVCGREVRLPADGIVELRKDSFQRFGLEFCALLVQCGKGRHFLVQPPKVQHLHPGRRRAFRDKK